MGRKRKLEKEDRIMKKIKKLEEKITRRRSRLRVISSSSDERSNVTIMERVTSDTTTPGPAPAALNLDHVSPVPRRLPPPTAESTACDQTVASTALPDPVSAIESVTDIDISPPLTSASLQDTENALDEDILQLLGEAPKLVSSLGDDIHKDIAFRWQNILQNGLAKEVKDKLFEEYLVPSNCNMLVAPALNPEVKAALPDTLAKRDFILLQKQKQVGIALAALSRATDLLVAKDVNVQSVLKPLSDACRILCDSHYLDTKTRRKFAISSVNTDLKDALINCSRGADFLFGEQLTEKLKTAKSVQKTGESLKTVKPTNINKSNFSTKNNSNYFRNRFLDKNRKNTKPHEAAGSRQMHRTPRQQPSTSRQRAHGHSPPPPPAPPAIRRQQRR